MKKTEEKISSDKEVVPEGIKQHANGEWYKEIPMQGLDEPLKLFNTLKSERLSGETYSEYKLRRIFTRADSKKRGELFYDSSNGVPYVNKNKKDKFKKKNNDKK